MWVFHDGLKIGLASLDLSYLAQRPRNSRRINKVELFDFKVLDPYDLMTIFHYQSLQVTVSAIEKCVSVKIISNVVCRVKEIASVRNKEPHTILRVPLAKKLAPGCGQGPARQTDFGG